MVLPSIQAIIVVVAHNHFRLCHVDKLKREPPGLMEVSAIGSLIVHVPHVYRPLVACDLIRKSCVILSVATVVAIIYVAIAAIWAKHP